MTINSVSPNPAINNQIQSNEVSSNTSLETNSFENYLAAETLPSIDTTKKPSIKELMDFANMSFEDASSILYGVVGSNEDTRDWNKILTSSDVLKTAKEETAKMYNGYTAPLEEVVDETEENPVKKTIDVQEGNIKFLQTSQTNEELGVDVVSDSLYLAASNGLLLRSAGNTPKQILDSLDAFGFSVEPLKNLAQNEKIPENIRTLLNETISYSQSNTQSYSTLELLKNSLNLVDNSKKEE